MSTQTSEARAYVFMMHWAGGHADVATIASSAVEAEEQIKKRYADIRGATFFGCAFAIMQPAIIERWETEKQWGSHKRIEAKGYYAFLQGFFFCKCGDYQIVAGCAKEKTPNGWTAIIYRHNHYIKPL